MPGLSLANYRDRLAVGIILRYNRALACAINDMVRPNDGTRGKKDLRARRMYSDALFDELSIPLSQGYSNPSMHSSFKQEKKNTDVMLKQWEVIDDYMVSKVERWSYDNYLEHKKKNYFSDSPVEYMPRLGFCFYAQCNEDYSRLDTIYSLDASHSGVPVKDPADDDVSAWFNSSLFRPWDVFVRREEIADFAKKLADELIPRSVGVVGEFGEVYDKETKEPARVPHKSDMMVLKAREVDMDKAAENLLMFMSLNGGAITSRYDFGNRNIAFPEFIIKVWDTLSNTVKNDDTMHTLITDVCAEHMRFAINVDNEDMGAEIGKVSEVASYYAQSRGKLHTARLVFNAVGGMLASTELEKGVVDNTYRSRPFFPPHDLPQSKGRAFAELLERI